MSYNKAVMSPGGNIMSKLLDGVKDKPKRRSLVERELETNMTARVTSPVGTSRTTSNPFRRSLGFKQENDNPLNEKSISDSSTPVNSSAINKMYASNSPPNKPCVTKITKLDNNNTDLNKIGDTNNSPAMKFDKLYTKTDLIQNSETDPKPSEKQNSSIRTSKPSTSRHLNNIYERAPENIGVMNNNEVKPSTHIQSSKNIPNGLLGNNSVVKTLDFDSKKKYINAKPENKNDIINLESESEYQIGDLAWARVGTYPFWPCVITRDPSGIFAKKKLFGRVEHYILHVTFTGDNGRRGWVVDNMLRKYLGIKEFLDTRDNFTPENKKKDRGFYNAFFISEKKQAIWDIAVKEAETLLKEPKQLHIDLLNQMIYEARLSKIIPKVPNPPKPICKAPELPSDLSLSESLFDTLFSEDDSKDGTEKARKSRKNSLDVSEVVTACLDNMAAKTGLSQIQKQSHMDRWLQKAKSSTPEKCSIKTAKQMTPKDINKEVKAVSSQKTKRIRKSINSTEHSGSECVSENGISDADSKNYDVTMQNNGNQAQMLNGDVSKSKKRSHSKAKVKRDHANMVNGHANDDHSDAAKKCKDSSEPALETKSDVNPKALFKLSTEGNTIVIEPNINNPKNVESDYEPCESPTFTQNDFYDGNDEKKDNLTIGSDVDSKKETSNHDTIAKDVGCESPTYTQNFMDINDTEVETNQDNDKQEITSIDGIKDEDQILKCQEKQQTSSTDCKRKNIGSNTDFESMDISQDESHTEVDVNAPGTNVRMDSEPNNVEKSVENVKSVKNDAVSDNNINNVPQDAKLFDQVDNEVMKKRCNLSRNNANAKNLRRGVLDRNDMQILSPVSNKKEKKRSFRETLTNANENDEFKSKKLNESTNLMDTKDNINIEDSDIIDLHNKSIDSDTSASILIDKDPILDNESVTKSVEEHINEFIGGDNITDNVKGKARTTKCQEGDKSISLTETKSKSSRKKQNQSKYDHVKFCKDVIPNIDNRSKRDSNSNKEISVSEMHSENNCTTSSKSVEENKIPVSPKTFKLSLRKSKDMLKPEIFHVSTTKNEKKTKKSKAQSEERRSKDSTDINSPEFLKYFELKRDTILDENPHLSEEDLLEYLFKTWLYEENLKTDVEKTDQEEQANLFKGLDREQKQKKAKKKVITLDAYLKIDKSTNKNKDKEQTDELKQSKLVNGLNEEQLGKRKATSIETKTINENKDKDSTDIQKKDKLEQSNFVKDFEDEQRPKKNKKREEKKSPKPETNKSINKIINKDKSRGTDIEKSDNLEMVNLVKSSDEKSKQKNNKKNSSRSTNNYNVINENKDCTDVEKTDKIAQTNLVKGFTPDQKPKKIKTSSPRSETNTDSKNATVENKDNEKSNKFEEPNIITKSKELEKEQQPTIIKKEVQSPKTNRSIDETSKKNKDKHSTEKNNISNTETLAQMPIIKDETNCDYVTISVDLNSIIKSPKSSKVSFIVSEDSRKPEIIDESLPKNYKIKEKASNKGKEKTVETKPVTKSGSTNMSNPEFLKYFELKKDALLDENPHLIEDDLLGYLYKTWLYEENLKTDKEKTEELEQANLVKGLDQDQQPKKLKKKVPGPEKNIEKVQKKIDVYFPKEKRNVALAYYYEDDTDIEDEIAMFEIPIKEPEQTDKTKPIVNELAPSFSPHKIKNEENQISVQEVQEVIPYDEQQFYLDQLLQPKPNIFKGLIREKACQICEKVFNLIKCKGCHGMFHVDCVKNMKETTQTNQSAIRNIKKKRGRKPKNALFGDENDETANSNSDENNVSFELKESNLSINLEEFELQFETKMAEMLKQNIKEPLALYPSTESCDWTKTVPGKCEIVDINAKPKTVEMADFKCHNCQKYDIPVCFVCKSALSPKNKVEYRQRCQVPQCFSYYHLECLDMWPQTQFNAGQLTKCPKSSEKFEAITCPRHVCHTCVCDDPRGCKTRFSSDKLAKCVRCPATYHSFTKCLPAGSKVLSASYIICPRHYEIRPGKVPCHVNTGWCFICALGGTLICCEYCPTSFHAECLNIKPPEGSYMCEDCETGRLPLYGEMVWVKLGHYRWWPALVLHPCEIPENILAVQHSLGEFVVRFFGQYDYYWVNRGRVFPFQEDKTFYAKLIGDSGRISKQKSKLDEAFTVAITHAKKAFDMLKAAQPNSEEDTDIASSLLPPHYVKLKVNKPVGPLTSWRTEEEDCSLTQCECDPNEEEPCGMYSQCLNRMLLTECGPSCRAGDRCHNRAFERRLYPRLTPYRTPHRGWGLKTLQEIKQGEFVIEYVGELIDVEEFQRRMGRKHEMRDENYYFLTLDKDRMIDAGPKGNLARFMNHCCEPNCETQKWTVLGDVRVGLFAIHDIPANSEVTFNYNLECAGIEKKKCMCGARRCSGYIGAKPKQDDPPPKTKRTYKKRKPTGTPSPSIKKEKKTPRAERSRTKETKPKEMTEIEKDLLIIKMATSAECNDCKVSLEPIEIDKGLKRKLSQDDDECPLISKVRKLDSNAND